MKNLDKDKKYFFAVAAENKTGLGEKLETETAVSPKKPPRMFCFFNLLLLVIMMIVITMIPSVKIFVFHFTCAWFGLLRGEDSVE